MSSNKQPGLPTEVSYNEAVEASKKYFDGDDLAATVWVSKYALKDSYGHISKKLRAICTSASPPRSNGSKRSTPIL